MLVAKSAVALFFLLHGSEYLLKVLWRQILTDPLTELCEEFFKQTAFVLWTPRGRCQLIWLNITHFQLMNCKYQRYLSIGFVNCVIIDYYEAVIGICLRGKRRKICVLISLGRFIQVFLFLFVLLIFVNVIYFRFLSMEEIM